MANYATISKTLSFWLRHNPEAASLNLAPGGWANVDDVLAAFASEQVELDWETLIDVVETNDKRRFELSSDASRIRARQGHSIVVEGDWTPAIPPDRLYHGTVEKFLDAILAEGLRPMARHHVHLSENLETATRVGARRGRAIVLSVDAASMANGGHQFFLTGNGVWLTSHVAPEFLSASPAL